ncbi:MAG: histidine--tRNA ligase [Candidatus Omnitrophica bacterium]|nr:histidine--tRNA ligase [Candidatus Omnitrophota bacterium]
MNKKFSVPRGTNDILPDAVPLWEDLEAKARKILKSYSYREIRTPVYEDIFLFKRSLGQTSDVVNKQLLELASNKAAPSEGDEGLALRPEGTAAVVRSYLENSMDGKEALSKLFYMGPMFRGERPQKGRLRQFHQIGVEAIGPNSTSPYLDAEVIALSIHLLSELGVNDYRLKINSLGSKEDKAHVSAWLRERLALSVSDLCEDCASRYERNVFRVLDCKKESCRKVVASLVSDLPLSDESQAYFQSVQAALKDIGIAFEIAPHLVRGLDYYTHTVFEITAGGGLGSQDAVGAGGRYNGLIHELGGNEKTNYGAIGFALGIERILLASGQSTSPLPSLDAYVIAMDAVNQSQAFALVSLIRKAGLSADMSYAGGSIKSQMGKANKANSRFALILGEEEMKNKTVALKDMQAGVQEIVAVNDIVAILKNKLT